MDTPILIGIHGVKQSGKSTAFRFIEERSRSLSLSASSRGFADNLKLAIAKLFMPGISLEDAVKWCDSHKEAEGSYLELTEQMSIPGGLKVTMRELLQRMGTEVGRDMFGYNFWVNQLLPAGQSVDGPTNTWHKGFENAVICGITDVRFMNEVERIHECGGVVWKIRNAKAEQAVIDEAEELGREIHPSELLVDDQFMDVVIDNNGSFDDLAKQIAVHLDMILEQL